MKLDSLLKAAKNRDAKALFLLGSFYELGAIVPANYKLAISYYLSAALDDYNLAFDPLARLFFSGIAGKVDFENGWDITELAILSDTASGFHLRGICFDKGIGKKRNPVRASFLYLGAVQRGDFSAIVPLVNLHLDKNNAFEDGLYALTMLVRAAEKDTDGRIHETIEKVLKNVDRYVAVRPDLWFDLVLRWTSRGNALTASICPRILESCIAHDYSPAMVFSARKEIVENSGKLTKNAYYLLIKAKRLKNKQAVALLAEMYINGVAGIRFDGKKAFDMLSDCNDGTDSNILLLLGKCYACGIGVEKSIEKAFSCLNSVKHPRYIEEAIVEIAALHIENRCFSPESEVEAFDDLCSVKKRNLRVLQLLSKCYLDGIGTTQNVELGIYYLQAIAAKNKMAYLELGKVYATDDYGRKDLPRAISYLKKAAATGHEGAVFIMAVLYMEEPSLDRNEAYKLLINYAERGNTEAQFLLTAYFKDDEPTALSWLIKAADGGNAMAQLLLGRRYREADGVEQNLEKAKYYLSEAHKGGVQEAKLEYAELLLADREEETLTAAFDMIREYNETYADHKSSMRLAYCYFFGVGTRKNKRRSLAILVNTMEQLEKEGSFIEPIWHFAGVVSADMGKTDLAMICFRRCHNPFLEFEQAKQILSDSRFSDDQRKEGFAMLLSSAEGGEEHAAEYVTAYYLKLYDGVVKGELLSFLQRICIKHDYKMCLEFLLKYYLEHKKLNKSTELAMRMMHLGYANGLCETALLNLSAGKTKTGVMLLEKSIELKETDSAKLALGLVLYSGVGYPQDKARAEELLRSAGKQGLKLLKKLKSEE